MKRARSEGENYSPGARTFVLVLFLVVAATFAVPVESAGAKAKSRSPDEIERIKRICEMNGMNVVAQAAAQCSHGEDPPPPGKDIHKDVKPVNTLLAAVAGAAGAAGVDLAPGAPAFACDGDGQSGYRTQVMYVHAAGSADRYSTYKASFLQWAWEADQIYRTSALDTGGVRRIRFVHDATCAPTVLNVTLSTSGDDNLTNTINELQQAGYDRSDRKYLIFMDANVLCGVGTMVADDRPGQENWNNIGPDYGRIDAGCWSGDIAAHEHMHNMGGVQNSAPHASGGNHCTDEYDVMCYSDEPGYPQMQTLCPTSSRDWTRFDCNYDDYFNTNPAPGSYLAGRWNTANNRFLAGDSGGVTPTQCPDQALEPDETHSAAGALTMATAKSRAFCVASDQDWMSFQAVANQRYRVEIPSHAAAITPSVEVYAGNGKRMLASNVPSAGGLAAVEFRARTGGIHYVRVKNTPDSYTPGFGNVYSVKVSPAAASGSSVGGYGYNGYSQIGGSSTIVKAVPTLSFAGNSVQVSGGLLHSASTVADGTVRSWGWNAFGQLGNGSTTDNAVPVQAAGLTGVSSVSAGYLHTLALKSDGTVWSWGWNGVGQLGDGTTTDRLVPIKVAGLSDIVEISAGWLHNVALKRDGTVWTWGYNGLSALGDGTTIDRHRPVQLSLNKVTAVAAGSYHSLAALEDGTVKGWGYNPYGQLGDGSRTNSSNPLTVAGLSGVYRVSAGVLHSVALKNDGSVWAWGLDGQGQAGGSPAPNPLVPTAINCGSDTACPKLTAGQPTMGKIVWISASGAYHTVALAEDGSVWGWGWNAVSQLGNGVTIDTGTAVKASGLKATDVAAGYYHSLYRS